MVSRSQRQCTGLHVEVTSMHHDCNVGAEVPPWASGGYCDLDAWQ